MALTLNDRVKQVSTTTGTGTITLGITPSGFQSFTDGLSDGDTTYYSIVNISKRCSTSRGRSN